MSWLDLPAARPRATLAVALLATLASVLLMFRFRPETSIEGLLDPSDPAVRALGQVMERFPVVEELLVLATLPEGAADGTGPLLAFAERFEDASIRSTNVTAARHAPDAQWRAFITEQVVPNGLAYLGDAQRAALLQRLTREGMDEQFARLSDALSAPGPAAGELAKQLRRDPLRLYEFLFAALRERLPGGMSAAPGEEGFFSPDRRSLLIRVSGARPPSDLDFCRALTREVHGFVDAANTGGLRVDVAGAYAVAAYNVDTIRHDAIEGTVTSVVGLAVLFGLLQRRPARSFLLAFVPMAMGLAWGFGAFALWSPKLTPLAAVVGGALGGIGIDYFVYVLAQHGGSAARRGTAERIADVRATLARTRGPLFAAWLTSTAGFVAIAPSPVRVLRDFAVLGALALVGAWLAAQTVLPAALALFDPPRGKEDATPLRIAGPLARVVERRPRGMLACGLALVALAAGYLVWSGTKPPPGSDLMVLQPRPNPPLDAQRHIAERMSTAPGSLQIYLHAADAPALLRLAHDVDARLKADSAVRAAGLAGTLGPASFLPRTNAPRVTVDGEQIARDLAAAAEGAGFEPAAFAPYAAFLQRLVAPAALPDLTTLARYDAVAQLVLPRDAARHDALCVAFFDHALDARAPRDAAVSAVQRALAGLDGATVTGLPVVNRHLEDAVRRDLPKLVLAAGAFIVVYHFVHFRSVVLALLTFVPTSAALLGALAYLSASGGTLNLVNMVAVPLLLGITVDYGILTVSAWVKTKPVSGAVRVGLSAVLMCAATTVLGFGTLVLVGIPAVAELGWLVNVGLGACVAGVVLVLWPVQLLLAERRASSPATRVS